VNRAYEEAFVEVDEILKMMPIDLLSKIPMKFRQVISENKAKDYKIEIKEPLEEEKLKEETVVLLGLIYRDFLASPEEKEELQLKDAEELKRIELEMQQQYDIENVFKIDVLLVFVNLKQYLSTNELAELYKYSLYNDVQILLIDSQSYGATIDNEKKLIIDSNLDEFLL